MRSAVDFASIPTHEDTKIKEGPTEPYKPRYDTLFQCKNKAR